MTRYRSIATRLILVAAVGPGAGPALAADPPSSADDSARDAVTERFEAAAPEIGEKLPDLPLVDARGREVRLRDLVEGRYAVLVLGCLT